ncbi:hypothetical protein AB0942_33480 [Streptomyces nodosus]|uniref:hypothetical protein n=1 Tax=Streptomyces nodosus TaxID=40318 RepID=UPI0034560BDA
MADPDWKRRLSDDVEVAIGISVDCGGTRGVHYVRDVVLGNVLPHIEAAYERGFAAGKSQARYPTRRKARAEEAP